VKRYFGLVLKNGQPYINFIRLTHYGQFKTGMDKKWTDINGEEYFTTENPGFIWQGKTRLFTAIDSYINGKGRLIVLLFSLLKIVDRRGDDMNDAELLRWLSESVWFPTNLLPSELLQWIAIDDHSATLQFAHGKTILSFVVTFNTGGEITQLKTKRLMEKQQKQTWIIRLSNYQRMNDVIVPTQAEVMWQINKKNHPYARFIVNNIEYDYSCKL